MVWGGVDWLPASDANSASRSRGALLSLYSDAVVGTSFADVPCDAAPALLPRRNGVSRLRVRVPDGSLIHSKPQVEGTKIPRFALTRSRIQNQEKRTSKAPKNESDNVAAGATRLKAIGLANFGGPRLVEEVTFQNPPRIRSDCSKTSQVSSLFKGARVAVASGHW